MRRFAINGYGEAQDVFEEIDAHPEKSVLDMFV